jgi:carboxypeptidase Taq
MKHSAYKQLEQRFRRLYVLRDAQGILHWDDQVIMPSGAAEARGEQLAELAALSHEMLSDAQNAALLAQAESESLDPWQQANLREMQRQYRRATALDAKLVAALTKASHASESAWRVARPKNDFASFAQHFGALLPLLREKAKALAGALQCSEYDALLDGYDPGMTSAAIDTAFAPLRAFLPGLIAEAVEKQRGRATQKIEGPFPVAQQKQLGERLMQAIGFDTARGRLDVSVHPFCGGATDDVRITTRYREDEALQAQFGVLHETGHALYEQQLPKDWRFQPVGEARGMSLHESQSLFVEMQIARSLPFARFAAPHFSEAFGRSISAEQIYAQATRVQPGLIRVSADEVTYPAHILLRYKLEKALLADELKIADLPGAWAEEMQSLLGLTPPDDKDGCLQDIHWPGGDIGYFPTYVLGHMIAAQLKAAMLKDVPDFDTRVEQGDFTPIRQWLGEKAHSQGSRYGTMELLQKATGEALNPAHYEAHLRKRYLS